MEKRCKQSRIGENHLDLERGVAKALESEIRTMSSAPRLDKRQIGLISARP